MFIKYEEMKAVFKKVMVKYGVGEDDADELAGIYADNSLDGIYSHGANRFPRFAGNLRDGSINPVSEITAEFKCGSFERWNGHSGLGPLNARKAMNRACDLAGEHGVGIVALGNNNHWMRGGSYGWQAANRGFMGICWSNTMPNMPVWGGVDRKIGNNPIIFAVPRSSGKHLVVDCALSQFSYGKLEEYKLKNEMLPVAGGYDSLGNLSRDPSEIEKTWRVLPAGYWKGSGISVALDSITSILTLAESVHEIGRRKEETGLSQIFIAINCAGFSSVEENDRIVDSIIDDIKSSVQDPSMQAIRYPGEREYNTRMENKRNGIPVNERVWDTILKML